MAEFEAERGWCRRASNPFVQLPEPVKRSGPKGDWRRVTPALPNPMLQPFADVCSRVFRGQPSPLSPPFPYSLNEPISFDLQTLRSRTSSISSQTTDSSRRGPLRADHALQTPRSASDREIEEINRLAEQAAAFGTASLVQSKPRPYSLSDIAKFHPTYFKDTIDDTAPSLGLPSGEEVDWSRPHGSRRRAYKIKKPERPRSGPVYGRYTPCLSDDRFEIYRPFRSDHSGSVGSIEREVRTEERQQGGRLAAWTDNSGRSGSQIAAPGIRRQRASPVQFVDNEEDVKRGKDRSTRLVRSSDVGAVDTPKRASSDTRHLDTLHRAVTSPAQRKLSQQEDPGLEGVDCSDSGSGSENESFDEDAQDCFTDRRTQELVRPPSDCADEASGAAESGDRKQSSACPATDESRGHADISRNNLSPVGVPVVRNEPQPPTSLDHFEPPHSSERPSDVGVKSVSPSEDSVSRSPRFPKDFLSQKKKSPTESANPSAAFSARSEFGANDSSSVSLDTETKSFVKKDKKKKKGLLANWWYSPKKGSYYPNEESVQSIKTVNFVANFHESSTSSKVEPEESGAKTEFKSQDREERSNTITDNSSSGMIEGQDLSGSDTAYVSQHKLTGPVCEVTAVALDGQLTPRWRGNEPETKVEIKHNSEEASLDTMTSERPSLESVHQARSDTATTLSGESRKGKLSLVSAKVLRGSNSPGAYENTSVTTNSHVTRHEIITIRDTTFNSYEKSIVFNDSGFPEELNQTFKATPVMLREGKVSPGPDSHVDSDGGTVRLSPKEDMDLFSKASRLVQEQRLDFPPESDANGDQPELVVIREYVFAANKISSEDSEATPRSSSHKISAATSTTLHSATGLHSLEVEMSGGDATTTTHLTSPDSTLRDSGLELSTSARKEPTKPKRSGRASREIDEMSQLGAESLSRNPAPSDNGQEAVSKQVDQPRVTTAEAVSGKVDVEKQRAVVMAAKLGSSSTATSTTNSEKPVVSAKPPLTTKPHITMKPQVTAKPEVTAKPKVMMKPQITTKQQAAMKVQNTIKPKITTKRAEREEITTSSVVQEHRAARMSALTETDSAPTQAVAVKEGSEEPDDCTITVDASSEPSHVVKMKPGESDDLHTAFRPQAFLNKLFTDQPSSEPSVKTVQSFSKPTEETPHKVSVPEPEEITSDTNSSPQKKPKENTVGRDTEQSLSDQTALPESDHKNTDSEIISESASSDTHAMPRRKTNVFLGVDDEAARAELLSAEAHANAVPDKGRRDESTLRGNDVTVENASGSGSVRPKAKGTDSETDTRDTAARSEAGERDGIKSADNASTKTVTDEDTQAVLVNETAGNKADNETPVETVKEERDPVMKYTPRDKSRLNRCRDSLTEEEYTKPWSNDFTSIERNIRNKITSAFPSAVEKDEDDETEEPVSAWSSSSGEDPPESARTADESSISDPEPNNSKSHEADPTRLKPPSSTPRKMSDPKPGRPQLPLPPPPPPGAKVSREEAEPANSKIHTEEPKHVHEDITREKSKPAHGGPSDEDANVSHQKARKASSEDKNQHHSSTLKEKFMKVFSHTSEDKKAAKTADHQGKKKSSPFTRKKVIKGVSAGKEDGDCARDQDMTAEHDHFVEMEQEHVSNSVPKQTDEDETHTVIDGQQGQDASSVDTKTGQKSGGVEKNAENGKSKDEDPKMEEFKRNDDEDETERKEAGVSDETSTRSGAERKRESERDPDQTAVVQPYVPDVRLPLSPRQAKKLIKAEKKNAARAQQPEEATQHDDPAAKTPNKALKWIKKKLATKGKKTPVSKKYNVNTTGQDEEEADAQPTMKTESKSAEATEHVTSASEDSSDSGSSDESDESGDDTEKSEGKEVEKRKTKMLPFWGGKGGKKKKPARHQSDSDTSGDESRSKLFSWSLGRKKAADSSDHEDNLPGDCKKKSDWTPSEESVGISGHFRKISEDIPQTTRKPASSDVDVTARKPASSDVDVTTRKPASSDVDVTARKPASSDVDVTTRKPASSDVDVTTRQPASSDVDVTTRKPVSSDVDVTTRKPASSDVDVTTRKPASSDVDVTRTSGRKKGGSEPFESNTTEDSQLKAEFSTRARILADLEDTEGSAPRSSDEQNKPSRQDPVTEMPDKTDHETKKVVEQGLVNTHEVNPLHVSEGAFHSQPFADSVSSPPPIAGRPKFTIVGSSAMPAVNKGDIGDYTSLRVDATGQQPMFPKHQRLSKSSGYELAHPFLLDEYSSADKPSQEEKKAKTLTGSSKDATNGVTEETVVPVQAERSINEAFNSLKKSRGDAPSQKPDSDATGDIFAGSGEVPSHHGPSAAASPPSPVLSVKTTEPISRAKPKLTPTRQDAVQDPVVEDEIFPRKAEEDNIGLKLSPNFKRQPVRSVDSNDQREQDGIDTKLPAVASDAGSVSDNTDPAEASPRINAESDGSPGRGTYLDRADFLDTAESSWRDQEAKTSDVTPPPHDARMEATETRPSSDVHRRSKPRESYATPEVQNTGNEVTASPRHHAALAVEPGPVSEDSSLSVHHKPDARPKPLPKPKRIKNNDSDSSSALLTFVDTKTIFCSTIICPETDTDSSNVDQADSPRAVVRLKKRLSSGKDDRESPVSIDVHTRVYVDPKPGAVDKEDEDSALTASDDASLTDVTPLPHSESAIASTPTLHSTPLSDFTAVRSRTEAELTSPVSRGSTTSSDTRTQWDDSCMYEAIFFDVEDPSRSKRRPEAPPVRPEKGRKRQIPPKDDPPHYDDDDADSMYDVPPSRRAFAFPRETSLPVISVVDKRISRFSPRSKRHFDPEPEDSIMPYATYFRPQSSGAEERLAKEGGCSEEEESVEYARVSDFPARSSSPDTEEGKLSRLKEATDNSEDNTPASLPDDTKVDISWGKNDENVEYALLSENPVRSLNSDLEEEKSSEREAIAEHIEESTPASLLEDAKADSRSEEHDQYLESVEYAHSVEEINKLYAALEKEEKEMERRERSQRVGKVKDTQKPMERLFSYEDQRASLTPLTPKADDEPEAELCANQTQEQPTKSSKKKKSKSEGRPKTKEGGMTISHSFTEVRTKSVQTKRFHTMKSFNLFRKSISPESSPKPGFDAESTKEAHSVQSTKSFNFFKKLTSNETRKEEKKDADKNLDPLSESVSEENRKEASSPPDGSIDKNKGPSSRHEPSSNEEPAARTDATGGTSQALSPKGAKVVYPVGDTDVGDSDLSDTRNEIFSPKGVRVLPPFVGFDGQRTNVLSGDVPAEQQTSDTPSEQDTSTDGKGKPSGGHTDAFSNFRLDVSDTSLEDEVLGHVVYAEVRKTSTASSVHVDPETDSKHDSAAPADAAEEEVGSHPASGKNETSSSHSLVKPPELDGKGDSTSESATPAHLPENSQRPKPARRTFPKPLHHKSSEQIPSEQIPPEQIPSEQIPPEQIPSEQIPSSDVPNEPDPSWDDSAEPISSSSTPLTNQGQPTTHSPDLATDVAEKATGKPDSITQPSPGKSDSYPTDASASGIEVAVPSDSAPPGVELTKSQTTPRNFGRDALNHLTLPKESSSLPATASPSHMIHGEAARGDSCDEDDSDDGESDDEDDDYGETDDSGGDDQSPSLPDRKYRKQMNKYNEYSNVIRIDSTRLKDARNRTQSQSNLAHSASADPSDKDAKLRNAISMEGGLEARGRKPKKSKKPKEAKDESSSKKMKTPSILKPLKDLFHPAKKKKKSGEEEAMGEEDNVYEVVDEMHQPKLVKHTKQKKQKVKDHAPKVKDHAPKVKDHAPKVKDHALKVKDHAPKVKDHAPKVKDHAPKVKDHAPSTHQPLKAVDSSHGSFDIRPIGRLLKLNPDGTQLLELFRPPKGNLGVQLTQGNEETLRGKFVSGFIDKSTEKLLSGILSVGDQILKINDRSVDDCPLIEVHGIIDTQQRLKFLVYPAQ